MIENKSVDVAYLVVEEVVGFIFLDDFMLRNCFDMNLDIWVFYSNQSYEIDSVFCCLIAMRGCLGTYMSKSMSAWTCVSTKILQIH